MTLPASFTSAMLKLSEEVERMNQTLTEVRQIESVLRQETVDQRAQLYAMRDDRAVLMLTENALRHEIAELHKRILSMQEKNWEHG